MSSSTMAQRYDKEFFMSLRDISFWNSNEVIDICNNYFRKVETQNKIEELKPKATTSSLPNKAAPSLRPMTAGEQWGGRNRVPGSQPTINWQDGCRGGGYRSSREELGSQAERLPAAPGSRAYVRDVPAHPKQEDPASQRFSQEQNKLAAVAKNGRRQGRADQDTTPSHPLKKLVEPFSPELLAPFVAKGLIVPPAVHQQDVSLVATTSNPTAPAVGPFPSSAVEAGEKVCETRSCDVVRSRTFRNTKPAAPPARETMYDDAPRESATNQRRRLRCFSEGMSSSISDRPCGNEERRFNRLDSVDTGRPLLPPATQGYNKFVDAHNMPMPYAQGCLNTQTTAITREGLGSFNPSPNVEPRRHIPLDPSPYSFSGRCGRVARFPSRGDYSRRGSGSSDYAHCDNCAARGRPIRWGGQTNSQYLADYYCPARPPIPYWPGHIAPPYGLPQEAPFFNQANTRCSFCNNGANRFPIFGNGQPRYGMMGLYRPDCAPSLRPSADYALDSLNDEGHYEVVIASEGTHDELAHRKQPPDQQTSGKKPFADLNRSPIGAFASTRSEESSSAIFGTPSTEEVAAVSSDEGRSEGATSEEFTESGKTTTSGQEGTIDTPGTTASDIEGSHLAEDALHLDRSGVCLKKLEVEVDAEEEEDTETVTSTESVKPGNRWFCRIRNSVEGPYEAAFLRRMLKAGALSMHSKCSQSANGPFCPISKLSAEQKEALFSGMDNSSDLDSEDRLDMLSERYGLGEKLKRSGLDAFLNSEYFSADAPIVMDALHSHMERFVDDTAVEAAREKDNKLIKKERNANKGKAKGKVQGAKRKTGTVAAK